MFSGMQTPPVENTPERQENPVPNDPQPKSKKEPVGRLANELIQLSGELAHLMLQAHLIHFNYEAGNFFGVHEFTKSQYEKHQKQLDRVGELVRSLDFMMPQCAKGLLGAYKFFDHIDSYSGGSMLYIYLGNLEEFGMNAKRAAKTAAKMDAFDIENYCGELIEDAFKSAWMIKANLRCM
jgi:DNA-binding ferritin-like protein